MILYAAYCGCGFELHHNELKEFYDFCVRHIEDCENREKRSGK